MERERRQTAAEVESNRERDTETERSIAERERQKHHTLASNLVVRARLCAKGVLQTVLFKKGANDSECRAILRRGQRALGIQWTMNDG